MTHSSIRKLSLPQIADIRIALESGRLSEPITGLTLSRYCQGPAAEEVARELQQLVVLGAGAQALAWMLRTIEEERRVGEVGSDDIDLVWTGPETQGAVIRDTAVVVRELFGAAEKSVIVVGFALFQGRHIFARLAERMSEKPGIDVKLLLNIHRERGDTTESSILVRRFAERFRTYDWPGKPLPEVYYDPRSLEIAPEKRAVLHAKCIVIDQLSAFISSANLTEAAHEKNLEVGALIRRRSLAKQLGEQFLGLIRSRTLIPAF